MIELVPLSSVAPDRVEALLDAAFGADRFGRTAYKLREGIFAVEALCFAAFSEDEFVGLIQCWPVALQDEQGQLHAMTLVGPVAVSPDQQRSGIGRQLIAHMLQVARELDHDVLVMIGDPEYYERFWGFSSHATGGWDLPGPFEPRRLLARIDRPGGLPSIGKLMPNPAFATGQLSA